MTRRAGFSLVEALVALSIAAIGLTAILELQRQFADGQRRYEQALARSDMQRNALALLTDLNPHDRPTGSIELATGVTLNWTSTPIAPAKLDTGVPFGDGMFEVQLYRVDATITPTGNAPLQSFSVDRMGWRRTVPAANPLDL